MMFCDAYVIYVCDAVQNYLGKSRSQSYDFWIYIQL
jgi:hypothetical protein